MGAGDTIGGDHKIEHQNVRGDITFLHSGIGAELADEGGTGGLYFNNVAALRNLAAGDQNKKITRKFDEGESILLSISADALAEAIDYNLVGSIGLSVVMRSKTDGQKWQKKLLVGDTVLSADPTSVVGIYILYFKHTVPAHHEMWLSGKQHFIAGETA